MLLTDAPQASNVLVSPIATAFPAIGRLKVVASKSPPFQIFNHLSQPTAGLIDCGGSGNIAYYWKVQHHVGWYMLLQRMRWRMSSNSTNNLEHEKMFCKPLDGAVFCPANHPHHGYHIRIILLWHSCFCLINSQAIVEPICTTSSRTILLWTENGLDFDYDHFQYHRNEWIRRYCQSSGSRIS